MPPDAFRLLALHPENLELVGTSAFPVILLGKSGDDGLNGLGQGRRRLARRGNLGSTRAELESRDVGASRHLDLRPLIRGGPSGVR